MQNDSGFASKLTLKPDPVLSMFGEHDVHVSKITAFHSTNCVQPMICVAMADTILHITLPFLPCFYHKAKNGDKDTVKLSKV